MRADVQRIGCVAVMEREDNSESYGLPAYNSQGALVGFLQETQQMTISDSISSSQNFIFVPLENFAGQLSAARREQLNSTGNNTGQHLVIDTYRASGTTEREAYGSLVDEVFFRFHTSATL